MTVTPARERVDVVVVGARCAGAAAAIALANAGRSVIAIDRSPFPSDTLSTHLNFPSSVAEMQRLGALAPDAPQLLRWRTLMAEAFTDVEAGDQLVGVYLPGQGARFYNRSHRLATLDDPAFAQAFFAIWLDPRTRDAALRRQLIGAAP